MRRTTLFLAAIVAACTPQPGQDIETDFDQRIATGGLSGAALADAYIDRGILHLAKDEPDAALADFDLAIQTMPDLAVAHVWRGTTLGAKGNKAGEKASYEHALAIDPDYWFAHGAVGLSTESIGRPIQRQSTFCEIVVTRHHISNDFAFSNAVKACNMHGNDT